ncbi:MAG: ribosome biogenesis GTPase Der [Bacillota bacterium]|nr:ribosome biogenesis GTPase Der [Bacillota bacterium]
MTKPLVAILGRPNVGKSTVFNRIVGGRISIVENVPGVTRDRIYADAEWRNRKFTVIDTGGMEPQSADGIYRQMLIQAQLAAETSDVIIFIVDGREGINPTDIEVAHFIRKTKKPVVLAVNKIDTIRQEADAAEFYTLGVGTPFLISAEHGLGIGEMLDEAVLHFPKPGAEEEDGESIRIAVVGKPNAGKSSLVNAILCEERTIVSEAPGTTRDAIDTPFEREGKKYVIIDTAGIRKKRSIEEQSVEYYGVVRAFAAIRRCDAALLVIDACDGVTEQDVKIGGFVHEEGKPCVIVMNKWDKIEKDTFTVERFKQDIKRDFAFMDYAPEVFISAKTGQRVNKALEMVDIICQNAERRIPTGVLNEVLSQMVSARQPPSDKGRRLKIFYGTQVSVKPPTFVIFVNNSDLMHYSYLRYLENNFRDTFDFMGTPIRLKLRNRGE